MKRLGINIDHVATIRNARGEGHPDILNAAKYVMKLGADSITIHLREDRRHINDKDLIKLSKFNKIPINLELSTNKKITKLAIKCKPKFVCLVPEKRNEVTTEGGLNLKKNLKKISDIIQLFNKNKIRTSLFINPRIEDIKLSKKIETKCIEIHTGKLSRLVRSKKNFKNELKKIKKCAIYAKSLGIEVHAGHGLDYKSTRLLTKIREISEFNIGHFIIGESIFFGLKNVIKRFKKICK
ncbi:pyridoxine 5'-phosphate synthase [Candidatus Pelagibacter sp.]|nr:pyridoxine 5'-phosphate synthase [Candidatus Pelagibacter sp.]